MTRGGSGDRRRTHSSWTRAARPPARVSSRAAPSPIRLWERGSPSATGGTAPAALVTDEGGLLSADTVIEDSARYALVGRDASDSDQSSRALPLPAGRAGDAQGAPTHWNPTRDREGPEGRRDPAHATRKASRSGGPVRVLARGPRTLGVPLPPTGRTDHGGRGKCVDWDLVGVPLRYYWTLVRVENRLDRAE